MILYRSHTNKFTRTQLRHQHQILRMHWQDRVSDVKVLRRANTPSAEALITASQLLWANHVRHKSDSRLPIVVLYGELSEGRRKRGGQKLRFQDVLKRHMENTVISPDAWEQTAANRSNWRASARRSIESIEEKRQKKCQRGHERRHTQQQPSTHAALVDGSADHVQVLWPICEDVNTCITPV